MIAGLPLDTWVLMAGSTLPALGLVAAAYLVHRGADLGKGGSGGGTAATDDGIAPRSEPGGGGERGPEAPQARPHEGGDDG